MTKAKQPTPKPRINSKQMAKIRQHNAEINRLVRQNNNLYSSLVSMVVLPAVATTILTSEYTPLGRIYHTMMKSVRQDVFDYLTQSSYQDFSTSQRAIEEVKQQMDKLLFSEQRAWAMVSNLPLCKGKVLSDCFDLVDSLIKSKAPTHNYLEYIKHKVYHYILPLDQRQNVDLQASKSLSLNQIYQQWQDNRGTFYTESIEKLEAIGKETGRNLLVLGAKASILAESASILVMSQYLTLGQMAIFGLIKALLISPIVQFYFPDGVLLQPRPKATKPLHLLTEAEAAKLSQDLLNHLAALKGRDQLIVIIARSLLLLSILAMVTTYFHGIPNSDAVYIFVTALFGVGGQNLVKDLYQYYNDYWSAPLRQKASQLQAILNGINFSQILVDNGHPENSSFKLELKITRRLSGKQIKKIVKKCLTLFGEEIIAEDKQLLEISGAKQFSKAAIAKMQQYISKSMERQKAVEALHEQLHLFLSQCGERTSNLTMQLFYDAQNLPNATYNFTLGKGFNLETFQQAFPKHQLAIERQAETAFISITGFEPAVQAKLTAVEAAHKQWFSAQQRLNLMQAATDSETRPRQQATEEESVAILDRVGRTEPTLPNEIKWNSASFFRAGATTQAVKPIESNSLPANRHFVLFNLKQKDFAGMPDAYHKFQEIVEEKRRIVPQKGAQGLVFCQGQQRNAKGEWVDTSLKAKALGMFGDARVYARREVAKTGETLHVFEAIKFKAH